MEERLTGVIDFYYACNYSLAYDLAVTLNDWCFEPDGELNPARWQAMLGEYRSRRELTEAERAAWPLVLRAAALRYVSRPGDLRIFLPPVAPGGGAPGDGESTAIGEAPERPTEMDMGNDRDDW